MSDTPDPLEIDFGEVPLLLTEAQVDEVFSQLDQYSVSLEEDPTVLGASYIHEKLKQCRDYSIAIESLLIQYYDIERKVKNRAKALEEMLKAERSLLKATDPWVSRGKSAGDREGRADYLLSSLVSAVNNLEEQRVNVEYLVKTIELKKNGLNRTNNDIKKQVSLMEFSKTTVLSLDGDGEDEDESFEDLFSSSVLEESAEETPQDLFSKDEGASTPEEAFPGDRSEPDQVSEAVQKHIDTDPDDPESDLSLTSEEDAEDFLLNLDLGNTSPTPEFDDSELVIMGGMERSESDRDGDLSLDMSDDSDILGMDDFLAALN
tara:strand:+ start:848 stop:1804 length:957 start_codon:yes stop_codon:yes gene_type:complete